MLNIIKEKKYIFILLIAIIILVCIIFNIIREKNTSKIVDNVDPFVEYAKTHIGEIDLSNNENVDIKDKRKYNNSKLIKKEHVYDLYKFDNMSISTQNDKCNISFDTFNLKDSSFSSRILSLLALSASFLASLIIFSAFFPAPAPVKIIIA